jgi:hypothetical protein
MAYRPNEKIIVVANGTSVPAASYGQLGILRRVYLVPLLPYSLLSVNALADDRIVVVFLEDKAFLHKGSTTFNF